MQGYIICLIFINLFIQHKYYKVLQFVRGQFMLIFCTIINNVVMKHI